MFLPKMFLHNIFHTRRSRYRWVLVKCCPKEILCAQRLWKIRGTLIMTLAWTLHWSVSVCLIKKTDWLYQYSLSYKWNPLLNKQHAISRMLLQKPPEVSFPTLGITEGTIQSLVAYQKHVICAPYVFCFLSKQSSQWANQDIHLHIAPNITWFTMSNAL